MADLQTLLNAIPQAQDGQPITSNYHNSLKDALMALVTQAGAGPAASVTLSFAPAFSPITGTTAWSLGSGVASKPTTDTQARGWMTVSLPDGMQIERLVIAGSKNPGTGPNGLGSWTVQLIRRAINGTAQLTLVNADMDAAQPPTGNFQLNTPVTTSSNVVDNTQFIYLILATVIGADAAAVAQIFGLQVVCNRTASSSGGAGTNLLFPFIA